MIHNKHVIEAAVCFLSSQWDTAAWSGVVSVINRDVNETFMSETETCDIVSETEPRRSDKNSRDKTETFQ